MEPRVEVRSGTNFLTAEKLLQFGVSVPVNTRASVKCLILLCHYIVVGDAYNILVVLQAIENLKQCVGFLEEDELRVTEVKRAYARLMSEVDLIRDDAAAQRRGREEADKHVLSLEEKVSLLKSELKAAQETGARKLDQARQEASYAVEQLEVARAEAASAREAMQKAEEALRTEVARLTKDRVAAQGPFARAVVERVLFSDSFSSVAAELARLASHRSVNGVLEPIHGDHPDLDLTKYAEPALSDDELDRAFAWAMMKDASGSVFLKEVESTPTLLTAEGIRDFPADKDEKTEALVADLRLNPPAEEDDEEEEDEEEGTEEGPRTGNEGAETEAPRSTTAEGQNTAEAKANEEVPL